MKDCCSGQTPPNQQASWTLMVREEQGEGAVGIGCCYKRYRRLRRRVSIGGRNPTREEVDAQGGLSFAWNEDRGYNYKDAK